MNNFQKKIFTSRWIFEKKIHRKSRHYKWIHGPNFSRWVTMMHVAQVLVWRSQGTFHVISCVIFMRSCCVFDSPRFQSSFCCPLSLLSSCSFTKSSASSSTMWWTNSESIPCNEDFGTFAEYDPLTGYEPNDFHISETTEPYIQESSGENRSLSSHDLEYDDYTIGMALSSPLFTQSRRVPKIRIPGRSWQKKKYSKIWMKWSSIKEEKVIGNWVV